MQFPQTILAIVIPILLTAILSALAWVSRRWCKQQEAVQDKKRTKNLAGWRKALAFPALTNTRPAPAAMNGGWRGFFDC